MGWWPKDIHSTLHALQHVEVHVDGFCLYSLDDPNNIRYKSPPLVYFQKIYKKRK